MVNNKQYIHQNIGAAQSSSHYSLASNILMHFCWINAKYLVPPIRVNRPQIIPYKLKKSLYKLIYLFARVDLYEEIYILKMRKDILHILKIYCTWVLATKKIHRT